MNKVLFLFLSFCLWSCNKDKNNIPKEPDLSQVKIVRVEQKVSPNQFPFERNKLITVDYLYNEVNQLTMIKTWSTSGELKDYKVSYGEDGEITIELQESESLMDPAIGSYMLKDIQLRVLDDRLISVKNNIAVYEDEEPQAGLKLRNIDFFYDDSLLVSAFKSIDGADAMLAWNVGGNLEVIENQKEKIAKYKVVNDFPGFALADKGQDLNVSLRYKYAPEIPQGLIALINQAVSGLSNLGMEDYFFHWLYNIDENTNISYTYVGDVIKPNYNFSDWIISFGLPQINTMATNENQIISSKNIKGKAFTDISRLGKVVYKQIDDNTYYNYRIDRNKKIIDIANLKIYYEIIE